MARIDVKGRVLIGERHLDVEPEYRDGPIPCIVERDRYVRDVLLPLTVRMLEDVQRSVLTEQGIA